MERNTKNKAIRNARKDCFETKKVIAKGLRTSADVIKMLTASIEDVTLDRMSLQKGNYYLRAAVGIATASEIFLSQQIRELSPTMDCASRLCEIDGDFKKNEAFTLQLYALKHNLSLPLAKVELDHLVQRGELFVTGTGDSRSYSFNSGRLLNG